MKITLRPIKKEDAQHFMKWGGDPEVTQSLFWDAYPDVATAEVFLRDIAEKHPWYMTILLDEVPMGAITLDVGKGRAMRRAELGYVIAKEYWGKGVTSEAVRIAIQAGFSELGLLRIDAYVDPDHLSSIRVLEKNGMIREGFLKNYVIHRGRVRDRFLYAITTQE
jgi:RimJ/RimL family protein N-acetyltransferase